MRMMPCVFDVFKGDEHAYSWAILRTCSRMASQHRTAIGWRRELDNLGATFCRV